MVEEFLNLKKGNMTVKEYTLNFSKLLKYAPSLVSNPSDEMKHFVMGVSYLVKEENRIAMLHD